MLIAPHRLINPTYAGGSGLILAPQGDGNDYLIRNNPNYSTGSNGEFMFAAYVYPLDGATTYCLYMAGNSGIL